MPETYLLGIDGGGTKTVCLVTDGRMKVLGRGLGGPSNYQSEGTEKARQSLSEAVREALRSAGLEGAAVAVLCAGLAGVARPRDHEIMGGILRELVSAERYIIEIDAFVSLVGATSGRPGIIISSGTGSVALGVNEEGQRARSGGWGFILGDEGSGYDIARRGLMAALRAYDGRGDRTMIQDRVASHLGLQGTEELIPYLYSNPLSPGKIAALYPIVLDAADEGDAVAHQLILDAAAALAEMVAATARRLGMTDRETLIAMAGGVFNGREIADAFRLAVKDQLPLAKPMFPENPPEVGALILAQASLLGSELFRVV